MAKRQPKLDIEEMENQLGYKIDQSVYPEDDVRRFYSDLRPISGSLLDRTQVEVEAHSKQGRSKHIALVYETLPDHGVPQVRSSCFWKRS